MRGQGYDNGANMVGKHSGLQNKIRNINPRAYFVPCASHSLNLVVNDAAKVTFEAVNFFNIVQELYTFFSASPYRWDILNYNITRLTLKSVLDTRWESRIKAVRPLRLQLSEVLKNLNDIIDDNSRDMKTKQTTQCLLDQVVSFKFICSVVIWNDILSKIDVVSKMLQCPQTNINESLNVLVSLLNF
jgi:hypothetical protein